MKDDLEKLSDVQLTVRARELYRQAWPSFGARYDVEKELKRRNIPLEKALTPEDLKAKAEIENAEYGAYMADKEW